MIEKETVSESGPGDIRRFLDDCLAVPLPEGPGSETDRLTQLLLDQLAEKCPESPVAARSGSWLLDRLQEQVRLELSRPVRAVLLEDSTTVETLRDLKGRYKERAEKAADQGLQRVYTALYFAAIARALVAYRKRITRHAPAYLAQSFEALAGQPWMAPGLRDLYHAARQLCQGDTPGRGGCEKG